MTHSNDSDSDQSDGGKGHGSAKSRRELPAGAVSTLKAWLLSPEHFTHPYPTPQDQVMLMQKTGIDKKQLKNWFTNARRRIWKPLLKKQLEQGTLTVTGTGSGSVAVGIAPGLMAHPGAPAPAADNTSVDVQAIQPNYQQAVQPHEQSQMHQQVCSAESGESIKATIGGLPHDLFCCFDSMIRMVTLYIRNSSTALSHTMRRAVLLDRSQRWEATKSLQLVQVPPR